MMSEAMPIEEYLAKGGVLSSPLNVPARYRGELMGLMARFVDSELSGSAGFVDAINSAPGISERIGISQLVLEKTKHAELVLGVMETFGVEIGHYFELHPWSERIPRDETFVSSRSRADMRLSIFHYPVQGWIDAIVMNALMSRASVIQLQEMSQVSYQPLAEVFRNIAPMESQHADQGFASLAKAICDRHAKRRARESVSYWRPRVAETFGLSGSKKFEMLKRFGLRHRPNEALLADWQADIGVRLTAFDLDN